MNTAENFWQWFTENKMRYYEIGGHYHRPLYLEFQEKLREFHPELAFQIGGILDQPTRILTISASGKVENFEAVEQLVSHAPIYDNWKITAFKQPDGFNITVKVNGIEFDPRRMKFVPLEIVEHPDVNAIRVFMEEYTEDQKELFTIGVSALLEGCLGEKKAATEINYIDVQARPTTPEEAQLTSDFTDLEEFIQFRKNQIKYN